MDREEILRKSRAENASAFMDERERDLRLREDSLSLGAGLLLALAMFGIKIMRGLPASDMLVMITGMSASGFICRAVQKKKTSDIVFAVLCTLLALFYFYRFWVGSV